MRSWLRPALMALTCAATLVPSAGLAQTSRDEMERVVKDYLAKHPQDIQRIVKDYLIENPEVLQEALAEILRRRSAGTGGPDKRAAIGANAAALFTSPRQVILGNPQGDVTLVEFFDYNCGFCKRALADKLALLKDDPRLKIVLKELPILGPGSREAARVAVAVRMQDPGGAKYLAFHTALLGQRGSADNARALAVARDIGLDMTRLEADMGSDEVRETLDEGLRLATTLGINGTPTYVVGDSLVVGAVGATALRDKIDALRRASRAR